MKIQKGFTIIELIVVIAIIAVLAAIVLVNVVPYIQKSKDAAGLAELDQAGTAAATWGDTNGGDFSNFCNTTLDPNYKNIYNNLSQNYTVFCGDENDLGGMLGCLDTSHWVLFLEKNGSGGTYFACIDSQGDKTISPNTSTCSCQ